MWVEVLMALLVEGYREFMEWWQTRAFLRPRRSDARLDAGSLGEGQQAEEINRAAVVADAVGSILDRHARKHVGVAVGVVWLGERWAFARGRLRATEAAPVDASSVFEIGSVTNVASSRRAGSGSSSTSGRRPFARTLSGAPRPRALSS